MSPRQSFTRRRALALCAALAVVTLSACAADQTQVTTFPPTVVTTVAPPARASRWITGTTGTIRPQSNNNLCVDVSGGVFVNGASLALANCNGASGQQWTPTSAGEYRTGPGLGYCVDTFNASSVDGTKVFLWNCYDSPSQYWTRTAAGELKNYGGKCAQTVGNKVKSGVTLEISTCTGSAKQKWNAPAIPQDTTTPPPPPPPGIPILPGASIQAAVDANPAGTVFLLKSGTHVRQSVMPKDSNTFRGEAGTVLDGENATAYAFKGWNGTRWVQGVRLVNFKFTRYAPPAQLGAIYGGDDKTNGTTRWVLDSLEGSYNANLAVRIGNRMQVLRSNFHHNSTINIGGVGFGVLVDGIESAYGNDGCVNNPGFESGGSKFAATDSLVVRNSFFHHNCGPGLWVDIDNRWYVLEGNRVEDNYREGIVAEISYAGVIRNNTVARNGLPVDPYRGNGWGWDAGIGIHASSDVEVYGNTLTDNFNGIVALQQNRGSGPYGPYLVQNLNVHDNTVTQRVACTAFDNGCWAGAGVQDVGDNAIFTSRNNRWVHNTYYLSGNPRPFTWSNSTLTPAQWQSAGQDVTGTFSP
jgi:parallel beta-helix repeat protein